jgi:hypothetical protein
MQCPGESPGRKEKIMDCSKTIDFFAEAKRHCDSRTACEADAANKEQCPMFGVCDRPLTEICVEDAIKAIEILQKWSDEHPKKTYAQDFFEKFPKAQSNSDGTPFVCRKRIYGGNCDYTGACYRCWSEPLNDE